MKQQDIRAAEASILIDLTFDSAASALFQTRGPTLLLLPPAKYAMRSLLRLCQ